MKRFIQWGKLCGTALLCAGFSGGVWAEDHIGAALQHAEEAAESQDSVSVAKHAQEAVNEIKAATVGKQITADKAKAVVQAVDALQSADKNAHYFNTPTAIEQAAAAKAHLESTRH